MEKAATRPLVSVRDIEFWYNSQIGKVRVMSGLQLDLAAGETIALVGPSGCGKTTLLGLVAGLLVPRRGTVSFRESLVNGPIRELGFVFQNPTLLPWLSAESNVLLPARAKDGELAGRLVIRARELLAEVGLQGFERAYPFELSGGMQQRVAIARALLLEPTLLILDEPLGSLDEPTRRRLAELLSGTITKRSLSCIFVSHDVDEAVLMASRVLVMSRRPMRILREIAVPLPFPRDTGVLADPMFAGLVGEARRVLIEEGAGP